MKTEKLLEDLEVLIESSSRIPMTTKRMVEEDEIMRIIDSSSIQYAGDVLKYVENNLEKTLESLRQNRESLKQTEQRTEENQ